MYDAAPDCDGDRSVRSLAPSFPMMCSRCTLTVSSEMNSSSPISRFLLPPDKQAKHFDLAFAERFVAEMFRQSRGYRGGTHLQRPKALDALLPCGCGSHHAHVGLAVDEYRYAFTNQRVIINAKNLDGGRPVRGFFGDCRRG